MVFSSHDALERTVQDIYVSIRVLSLLAELLHRVLQNVTSKGSILSERQRPIIINDGNDYLSLPRMPFIGSVRFKTYENKDFASKVFLFLLYRPKFSSNYASRMIHIRVARKGSRHPSPNASLYSSSCPLGSSSSSAPPSVGGASPLPYSLLVIGYATLLSFSFCSSKSSVVAVAPFSSSHSVASLTASRS